MLKQELTQSAKIERMNQKFLRLKSNKKPTNMSPHPLHYTVSRAGSKREHHMTGTA